jgi:hypothetical protein
MTRVPRSFALTSDLRFEVFAALFGIGTVHHELEFLMEQGRTGSLWEYMERWSRAIPSIGWTSETGLALHLGTAGIGLLVALLPWRRELLCLLAPVFLLSQLASPDRIGSHNGLMASALLVVFLLGVGEWIDRAAGRPSSPRADWYHWTLTGLAWVCALTYVFAFLYKLNPVWFSGRSGGPPFLVAPLAPVLSGLGLPGGERVLAAIAIWGTLLVEVVLPPLLFWPRTRLLACLIGLGFHLPMIAGGVSDFPTLIVALYPAFLSLDETRELVRRCRAHPTRWRVAATLAVVGLGISGIVRVSRLRWVNAESTRSDDVVRIINTVATWATFVVLAHVTMALAEWLLERGVRNPLVRPTRPGEVSPAAGDGGRRPDHPSRVPVIAAASVIFVGAAFVYNNVGLFFGLPVGGAMVMYSGIEPDRSNHFVMPRIPVIDTFTYVRIIGFDARNADTPEIREFRAFVRQLDDRKNAPNVQLNIVRYQMDRICRSAPAGVVSLAVRSTDGTIRRFADVCAEPGLRRYWPIPIGGRCKPSCNDVFSQWARGKLRGD